MATSSLLACLVMLVQVGFKNVHAHVALVSTNGFNDAQRQAIVDKHNEYRRMEPATAMMRLEYDMALEFYAQKAAETCNFAHTHSTPKELRDTFGGDVGENIYVTSDNKGFIDTKPVTDWWEEINHYDYHQNLCAANKQCGHYTQVVWANTTSVGCGVASCPNGITGWDDEHTEEAPHTGFIVFCQYGPAGNWRGKKPFIEGPKCSGCPGNSSHCGDNLCSAHRHTHRIKPSDCLHGDKQIIMIEGLQTRCATFLDQYGDGQCERDIIREQCCQTCSERKNHNHPSCSHGDKAVWCSVYVPKIREKICTDPRRSTICCESCGHNEKDKEKKRITRKTVDGVTTEVTVTTVTDEEAGSTKVITRTVVTQLDGSKSINTRTSIRRRA